MSSFFFGAQPRRDQKEEEEKERYVHKARVFKSKSLFILSSCYVFELQWASRCEPLSIILAFSLPSGKLPKNCDPKATPDQERWLPMRERTYYRGKKKGKKKEQIGKGTQGATVGASAEL